VVGTTAAIGALMAYASTTRAATAGASATRAATAGASATRAATAGASATRAATAGAAGAATAGAATDAAAANSRREMFKTMGYWLGVFAGNSGTTQDPSFPGFKKFRNNKMGPTSQAFMASTPTAFYNNLKGLGAAHLVLTQPMISRTQLSTMNPDQRSVVMDKLTKLYKLAGVTSQHTAHLLAETFGKHAPTK
jgi:pyruvate/2-oxoglutarate dehydrogenase complex dihydrolipoamide acyltransferase (E2) component